MKVWRFPLLILSLSLSACSFQKEPDKRAQVIETKEVKVGMTAEEMEAKLTSNTTSALSDRILYAMRAEDEELLSAVIDAAQGPDWNAFGSTGETGLEVLVRYGAEELALRALSKGASPYKFHKGTKTRILDILSGSGSRWDEVTALMPVVDKKLYDMAYANLIHPDSAKKFYFDTGFPFLKSLEVGSPSLFERIGEFVPRYREMALHGVCTSSFRPLIELIVHLEGDIKGDAFAHLKTFFAAEDFYASQYFLSKLGRELNYLEKSELITELGSGSLRWLKDSLEILPLSEDERRLVGRSILERLKGWKDSVWKTQLKELSTSEFLRDKYPDLYAEIYSITKDKSIDIHDDTELAGGILPTEFNWLIKDFYKKGVFDGGCGD